MLDLPGMSSDQLRDWAEARVRAGVAELDRVRPGWAGKIDLTDFFINLPCSCVVGQCTGIDFFEEGVEELFQANLSQDAVGDLGLTLKDGDQADTGWPADCLWDALQYAWEKTIASRQKLIPDGITAL
jgi:hypothetical protein